MPKGKREAIFAKDIITVSCTKGSFPVINLLKEPTQESLAVLARAELAAGYEETVVERAKKTRLKKFNLWRKGNRTVIAEKGTFPPGHGAGVGKKQVSLFNDGGHGGFRTRMNNGFKEIADLVVSESTYTGTWSEIFGSDSVYANDTVDEPNQIAIAKWVQSVAARPGYAGFYRLVLTKDTQAASMKVQYVREIDFPGFLLVGGYITDGALNSQGSSACILSQSGMYILDLDDYNWDHSSWGRLQFYRSDLPGVKFVKNNYPVIDESVDFMGWEVFTDYTVYGGPSFTKLFTIDGKVAPQDDGKVFKISTDHLGLLLDGAVIAAMSDEDKLSPEEKVSLLKKSLFCRRSMRSVRVGPDPARRTNVYHKVDKKGGSDGVKELDKSHFIDDEDGVVTWKQANARASGASADWSCYFNDAVSNENVRLTVSDAGQISAVGDGHTGQFIPAEDGLAYFIGGASVDMKMATSATTFFENIAGAPIGDLRGDSDMTEFSESYIYDLWATDRSSVPSNRLAATDMIQFSASRAGLKAVYDACMLYGNVVTKTLTFEKLSGT